MDNNSLNFRLKSIAEICFEQSNKDVDIDAITFSFYTQTIINIESDEVKVVGGIMYKCQGAEVLKLETEAVFGVEELNKIITIDSEKSEIAFNVNIIPTLLTTTIGAMRGIVFEKSKDNKLASVPFPLISMEYLLNNNSMIVE